MDVRERIDIKRRQLGWTRTELAKKVGVRYTAIKNWYNEKNHMPSLGVLEEICEAYNITMAALFTDVNTDKLREDQMALLELYEKLTEKQRKNILDLIKSIVYN